MKYITVTGIVLGCVTTLLLACNTKKNEPAAGAVDKEQIKKEIQAKEDEFAAVLGMWVSARLIVMNILQSRLRAIDQNSIRGMASHTHLPLLIMHEAEG